MEGGSAEDAALEAQQHLRVLQTQAGSHCGALPSPLISRNRAKTAITLAQRWGNVPRCHDAQGSHWSHNAPHGRWTCTQTGSVGPS